MPASVIRKLVLLTLLFGLASFGLVATTVVGAAYAHHAASFHGVCGPDPADIPEHACGEEDYLAEFWGGFNGAGLFMLACMVSFPSAGILSYAMCVAFVRSWDERKRLAVALRNVTPAFAAGVFAWFAMGWLEQLLFVVPVVSEHFNSLPAYLAIRVFLSPCVSAAACALLLRTLLSREAFAQSQ